VIAILITIMVLELKIPHGNDWHALEPMLPAFLTYVLSFIFLGIYWNNHHHMLHATERISGRVLWANMHLLFWLSLVPVTTGWMGETGLAAAPTALYGAVLLLSGLAYTILQHEIILCQGTRSKLAEAVGRTRKEKISTGLYVVAVPLALVSPTLAVLIYIFVAASWLVPDRRIEARMRG
jgi:uncharacterized membrane protein